MAHELLKELQGIVCRCGKVKRPHETFCKGCYWSLGQNQRNALYKRMGDGYEQAYAAAAAFLDLLKANPVPRRARSSNQ
jgi:hypothetical protein